MNNTVTQTAIATRTIPDIPDPAAKGWTKIANTVIAVLPQIGHAAFVVYVVIAKHANQAGVAWPSAATVARLTGVTERTVHRAIRTLRNKGLIRVERRKDALGRDLPSHYTLSPDRESVTRAPLGCHKRQGEGDTNDTPRVTPEHPELYPLEQDPLNKTSCRKLRFDEADRLTASWMFSLIQALDPKAKQPDLDKWAGDVRLMRERDSRTDAEIRATFAWANRDSFWQSNILSAAKLREKFGQLSLKMKVDENGNHRSNAGDVGSLTRPRSGKPLPDRHYKPAAAPAP